MGNEPAGTGTPGPAPGTAGWPDAGCPFVGGGHNAAWTQAVEAAQWQPRKIGDETDYYKELGCPRCGHNMTVFLGAGAYRAAENLGVVAACDCVEDHKARPDGSKGCGYGAWIAAPGGSE